MQKGLKLDGQMRGLALSLGGGAVMAIVAMLIPVSVFESITGATGISELVPATAAPLGDTARAIIAFLFAAGAFAGLAAIFVRQPVKRAAMRPAPAPVVKSVLTEPVEPKLSMFEQMRKTVTDWVASRRSGPVVTELSDLPKLRAGDAHPDAPPRRPISATRDFGEIDAAPAMPISQLAEPVIVEPEVQQPVIAIQEMPVTASTADTNSEELVVSDGVPLLTSSDIMSVHAMVDQLEAAVSRRQAQLARLEVLAVSQQALPVSQSANTENAAEKASLDDTNTPPPLEVVPPTVQEAGNGDEMDDALRSALETLQRMNTRSR